MPKKIPKTIRLDIKKFIKQELIKGNVSKINMRYIAKNLEIGTGTIYNYFDSKEDIFFEIAKDDWKEEIYSKIQNVQGNDVVEKLENILKIVNEKHKSFKSVDKIVNKENSKTENEKYYYFFLIMKKMNKVVIDDLCTCITNILNDENIKYNELQCKMIANYIRFSVMEDNEEYREIATILYKILN